MDDAELVNKPLEAWTKWALVWLTVFPFVGILVSIRFHNREFLGGMPLFTFGRLRSVHLGGVRFGLFTSALIALFYYRSAVRHAAVQSGVRMVAALIWNAFLTFGSLSLCMGYMVGVAPEPHVIYRRRDCGHSDRWHDITSPRISLLRVPVVRTRRRSLDYFQSATGRRALSLWPCERREQRSDPWPVHAQSGGSLDHAGEAGDDLLFSHAERQEYADPGRTMASGLARH